MAHESEGAQLRLEVPHHNVAVGRPRDYLLHVCVERHRRDGVMMAAEGAHQRRVLRLKGIEKLMRKRPNRPECGVSSAVWFEHRTSITAGRFDAVLMWNSKLKGNS